MYWITGELLEVEGELVIAEVIRDGLVAVNELPLHLEFLSFSDLDLIVKELLVELLVADEKLWPVSNS